jgi:hypothetical protein
MLCRDPSRHPLFILSFLRLAPHESREITVTHHGRGNLSVSANAGFYSITPQSIDISGNEVSSKLKVSAPNDGTGCRFFGYFVDEKEHEGMYWFGTKDGNY